MQTTILNNNKTKKYIFIKQGIKFKWVDYFTVSMPVDLLTINMVASLPIFYVFCGYP